MAKKKKRNPQDTTLRNNRARAAADRALAMRIGALEQRVAKLEKGGVRVDVSNDLAARKPRAVAQLRGGRK